MQSIGNADQGRNCIFYVFLTALALNWSVRSSIVSSIRESPILSTKETVNVAAPHQLEWKWLRVERR